MKKLKADWSQGMLAIIWCRMFLSSSLLSKNIKIEIYRTVSITQINNKMHSEVYDVFYSLNSHHHKLWSTFCWLFILWNWLRHGIWNILKYNTIILPVVLYGCQAWSLILRKEHRLRFFENRVLRKIFGPKRDEVIGERRRLHNKGLYDLYSSPNIIPVIKSRRIRWAGHVVCMGARRGAYRVLVVTP